MQKALKDDEELVVWFANAGEKLRVMEIFLPSPKVAVLSGHGCEAQSDARDFAGGRAATGSQGDEGGAGREAAAGGPGHAEGERFQRVMTRVSRS